MNDSHSFVQLKQYQAGLAGSAARLAIDNEALLAELKNEPLAAERGLAVYANNRSGVLIAAMEAAFPVCQWMVGDQYFLQLIKHWLGTQPRITADLNQVGHGFVDTLAELCEQRPELSSMLWLPDLATLEYAIQQSYYADASRVFDTNAFAELAATAIDNVVFQLSESTQLLSLEWDTDVLWRAYQTKTEPQSTLLNQPSSILVHRPSLQVELLALPVGEAAFIASIQNGGSFANLAASHPEQLGEIGSYIGKGWVDRFSCLGS